MKKILISAFVLLYLFCSSSEVFAQLRKDISIIRGKLIRMELSRNEVTIKDNAGKEKTFISKKGLNKSLAIGSDVLVTYKIGTNVANKVVQAK